MLAAHLLQISLLLVQHRFVLLLQVVEGGGEIAVLLLNKRDFAPQCPNLICRYSASRLQCSLQVCAFLLKQANLFRQGSLSTDNEREVLTDSLNARLQCRLVRL